MDDDRRGFGPVIIIAVLVILLVALGGGGLVVTSTMRNRMMAQRAEMEARAAQAEAELQGVSAVTDALKGNAKSPIATDPLTDVNDSFRAVYRAARQDALTAGGPVVIVSGDDLILIHKGKRTSATVVPPLFHELKAYSHIPLAAYLMARPGFNEDRRAELTMFLNQVESTRGLWDQHPMSDEQRRRQQTIVDECIRFLKDVEKDPPGKPADRTAFARKMAPLVLANSTEAARAQIDGLQKQMTAWRAEIPPDDWKKLNVIVMGAQMPRNGNISVQYFAWLLGEAGEGKRIIYSEAIFDESKALNLLGTHRVDINVGIAFFDEERRMHRDLLADAAKEILKGMKP
jgi:hypothetical protein